MNQEATKFIAKSIFPPLSMCRRDKQVSGNSPLKPLNYRSGGGGQTPHRTSLEFILFVTVLEVARVGEGGGGQTIE